MVLVGAITGAHGIRGEVKLRSFTADPAAIASYSPLETAKGAKVVIADLNQQFATPIRIDDSALAATPISGVLILDDQDAAHDESPRVDGRRAAREIITNITFIDPRWALPLATKMRKFSR